MVRRRADREGVLGVKFIEDFLIIVEVRFISADRVHDHEESHTGCRDLDLSLSEAGGHH